MLFQTSPIESKVNLFKNPEGTLCPSPLQNQIQEYNESPQLRHGVTQVVPETKRFPV